MLIFIVGGARSGKSEYAERRAMELSLRRVYVATAEVRDEEMAQRVVMRRLGLRNCPVSRKSTWQCRLLLMTK